MKIDYRYIESFKNVQQRMAEIVVPFQECQKRSQALLGGLKLTFDFLNKIKVHFEQIREPLNTICENIKLQ